MHHQDHCLMMRLASRRTETHRNRGLSTFPGLVRLKAIESVVPGLESLHVGRNHVRNRRMTALAEE